MTDCGSEPAAVLEEASRPRIPLLHQIGGFLLAWFLPPVFAIVIARRWTDVPKWLRVCAVVLSLVFTYLLVLTACTRAGDPHVLMLAVLPTYTAFAAAWMCHRSIHSSILLKIVGTFIWVLFGLQAAFLLYKLPYLICTAAVLLAGAAALAVCARGRKIQPVGVIKFITGYAGIAGLIMMCIAGVRLFVNSRIKSELHAVRRSGSPVTWRELAAYYPAPAAGKNAADVYASAFANYVPGAKDLPLVGSGVLPPRGKPLPREMKTGVALYLAENARAIELLHAASGMTECRFPLDFAQGYGMPIPHLTQLRQGARMLELEALMEVEGGHPDRACEAVKACIGLSRSLRNEPVLTSQLVRMAIDSIGVMSLERVLSRTAVTDKQLAELSAALVSEEETEGLVRALAGERCMAGDLSNLELKDTFKPFTTFGVQDWDHLTALRLTGKMVSAAQGPLPEMRARQKEIQMEADRASRLLIGTKLTVPALPRSLEAQLTRFARLRSARTGIAVERFRLANGRLPDSLPELVPGSMTSAPTDPFDDKPLRYRKLKEGFVVYSVGPDLKDDGGAEPDPRNKNPDATWDITFTVAR